MQKDSSAERFYMYTLVGLAAVSLVLQAASLGPLRNSFWGFHLYAFLSPVVTAVFWTVLVLAALLLVVSRKRRPREKGEASERREEKRPPEKIHFIRQHPVASALAMAGLCAVVFWLFRSEQLLLGDAHHLKVDLAKGKDFHPRQPLTMWIQHALYQYLGPFLRSEGMRGGDVAQRVVAVGSVVAGALYVLVAAALGRLLARGTSHGHQVAWLATLILISQGFVQLFFGYIENYTFYALAIGVYLWLSLRFVQGLSPLVLPGLALVLAVALHLSAVVLVPSFVVLSVWAFTVPGRRLSALLGLAVCAGVVIGVNQLLLSLRDYNLLAVLFDISGRVVGGEWELIPNYMFSPMHFRDFLNEQFLIGPLGLLVFVPAAAYALRVPDRRSISTLFFLVLGLSYFAASWMAGDSNLGYARNWDLLAPAGVCFTAAALYFLAGAVSESDRAAPLLKFGLVFSILHLATWVWINHNEDLALERFKTLPLGFGRTEVVVGNWYLERNRTDEAATWFRRAVEVNPNNGPAYAFLGVLATRQNRLEDARGFYERAVALRPDKSEFRYHYVVALLGLGRQEEAVPHLEWLTKTEPGNKQYWRLLGSVLLRLDRTEDLVPVYERLLRFAEETLEDDPDNEDANVEAGILLTYLNREEEALLRFRRALQANPSSPAGLFNTASLLIHMGRTTEAQPVLERFVQLYPDHPNAAWARQHLQR